MPTEQQKKAFAQWLVQQYGQAIAGKMLQDIMAAGQDIYESYIFKQFMSMIWPEIEASIQQANITPEEKYNTIDELMLDSTISIEERWGIAQQLFPNDITQWLLNTEDGTWFLENYGTWDFSSPSTPIVTIGDYNFYASWNGYAWDYFQAPPIPTEGNVTQTFTDSRGNIWGYEITNQDGSKSYVASDAKSPVTLDQIQTWVANAEETYQTGTGFEIPSGYEFVENMSGGWIKVKNIETQSLHAFNPTSNQLVPYGGEIEDELHPMPPLDEGYTIDPETGIVTGPEGIQSVWDPQNNMWLPVTPETLETGIEPPPMPTEAPAPGYIWVYNPDLGVWYQAPGELPEQPQNIPEGYSMIGTTPNGIPVYQDASGSQFVWDEDGGQMLPYLGGLAPAPGDMTDYQTQQLELQRQELELYAQQLAQQAQLEQDRLKLEYSQYLAGLAANPMAFMEYAVATGQAAAVQPWMPQLDPTGQLQAGQALPGWGPGTGGQMPIGGGWTGWGGSNGGGVNTGGGLPPPMQGSANEGWEPIPQSQGGGYQQTGGLPYYPEMEKVISQKYREILDQLSTERGGIYMSPEWFSNFTMEQKYAITQEAERLARDWYNKVYGEEYPVYPQQQVPTPGAEVPNLPPVQIPPTQIKPSLEVVPMTEEEWAGY